MKGTRQSEILHIIETHKIETQEELARYLEQEGYRVTQATVSRDIKELGLIKVADKNGGQRYAVMQDVKGVFDDRVKIVFRQSVVRVDIADYLIVLHTLPGMAQAAAMVIDGLNWPEIVGTIAGDDTIFVALHDGKQVSAVAEQFRKLMKGLL
jgi:transcriptional regulator of arginine metabolism